MVDNDSSLAHYGVKGMRWGVRRASRTPSSDHAETRDLLKKKNMELSTPELKKINNRLQLEKTKNELTNAGALRKIKAGAGAVAAVLAIGGTINAAIQFAQSPAGKAAKASFDKVQAKLTG